jgi:site-specific recombinase
MNQEKTAMFQAILLQAAPSESLNTAKIVEVFQQLIQEIRPKQAEDITQATHAIQSLCFVLNEHPELAQYLRQATLTLLEQKSSISLFTDAGIQPNQGFFTEMFRRISHKLLPAAIDEKYLKDVFSTLFNQSNDVDWVTGVSHEVWASLFTSINLDKADSTLKLAAIQELKDAVQVLSYRLSASGLEPELIRNHENLEDYDSPFITQNIELLKFLSNNRVEEADIKHIHVMLDQCQHVISQVRKTSAQTGTSIQLTALIQRIQHQIVRLRLLIEILTAIELKQNPHAHVVTLFKTLVDAECNKNNLRTHWRQNLELMALRVTDNAGHTGEHYIAENKHQYYALMRSAMGAGVIIALMAVNKILITGLHLPPLSEAILISLNYGIGFVIIHILHFTVATKQPAMTASTIASTIEESDNKHRNLDKLVGIISQTISSQTVAILGNIIVVIPVAILIDWIIQYCTGHHFITVDKAHHLLNGNNPLISGAVFYAAVAGVCLFLAGLIAGYHDNLSAYNKIPERIQAVKWLERLLGKNLLHKVANYIRTDLGALAGNFYFGCLLGGVSGLGVMLGLPLDIRHVTFVAAFFGFSSAAMDFQLTHYLIATGILGIFLVATMNLITSFFLALYVAMKSRKVRFEHWKTLIKTLLTRLNRHPGEFFLPPKT